MKKISCICPTANRPRFIAKSIELFLAQTYEDKELIIIDSGTPGVKWPDDPRVIHVVLGEKMTVGEKYRLGMTMADGEYMGIWDDDDWSGPERLKRSIEQLESNGVDAVGTTPILALIPRLRFAKWSQKTIDFWHNDKRGSWMPCSDNSLVWRRSKSRLGEPFGITMHMFERMHRAGAKFMHIDNEGFFCYVRHPDVEWRDDWSALTDPIERPAWIPDSMVEFWNQYTDASQRYLSYL